jgi:hypothetical protein
MSLGWLLGSPRQQKASPEASLRVQTSLAGRAIPVGWGQFAVAPNLIWYGNFSYKKTTQGGKGLGIGGGKGGATAYNYSASIIGALCEGPIDEVLQVWNGPSPVTLASLNIVPFLGTYAQTPWGYLSGNNQPIQEWRFVPSSGPFAIQATYHGTPFVDSGVFDNQGNQFKKVTTLTASQQYTVNTASGTYTFYSADAGAYVQLKYTAGDQPTQALGYRGIAYVAAADMQLGQSPELPNMRFEILSTFNGAISGFPDADPSEVVSDYLTNVHYGMRFPSGLLGDLSIYQAYCLANGLVVSPILVDQQEGNQFLSDLMSGTNSELVWNGSTLTAVPYGDVAITANGYTYTPPSSPIYALTDADYLAPQGGNPNSTASLSSTDPVQTTRKPRNDQNNVVKVELLDRGNGYNPVIVEAKDDAAINVYGLRVADTKQLHYFCVPSSALTACQLMLGREQILRTFTFTVGQEYWLLDPMDIIEITDANQGLIDQWVRITEITENSDFSLTITSEEYLAGTGTPPQIQATGGAGFQPNRNVLPPATNAPIAVPAPYQLAQQLQIWLVASGPLGWGGCFVWVSSDGTTYNNIGTMEGACRQGFLATTLPLGTDPDTVDRPIVDLSESAGELISGTQVDADDAHTLCYVDGELISFETATLIAANTYNLSYLRRGLYNTTIRSHSPGVPFARLDDQVFPITYDKSKIGSTLFIKLQPFNQWAAGVEDLSDIDALEVTLPGIPPPKQVSNFSAFQQGTAVVFSWDQINEAALKGYDIGYAAQGTVNWSLFTLLTEAAAGTEMTNASVPPGTWTFAIRARDVADQLSAIISYYDLVVVDNNDLLLDEQQDPDWPGGVSGLVEEIGTAAGVPIGTAAGIPIGVGDASMDTPAYGFAKHWTGVLVPMSQNRPSSYAALSAPSAPTVSQVLGGALLLRTYYVAITYQDSTGETLASSNTTFIVSALHLATVTSPSSPSSQAIGWNIYAGTAPGALTQQNTSTIAFGTDWTEPTSGLGMGAAPPTRNGTGWQTFDVSVPDVVPQSIYVSNVNDIGFDIQARVFSTNDVGILPDETGPTGLVQFEIDIWLTGETDPGVYVPWTIADVNLRYLRGAMVLNNVQGSVGYLKAFSIIVDRAPTIEHGDNITVAPDGTHVTFTTPYHLTPFVVTQYTGTNGELHATPSNITTTGFDVDVWDLVPDSVGGTVTWTSSGE